MQLFKFKNQFHIKDKIARIIVCWCAGELFWNKKYIVIIYLQEKK